MSDLLHQMMIAGMPRASEDPPIVTYPNPVTRREFLLWCDDHARLGLCKHCPAAWSLITHWEKCPASTGRHEWAEPCPYTGDIP